MHGRTAAGRTVSAEHCGTGFREFIATDVVLVTRDIRRIDAVLQTGGFEAAVKVTAGSTPIELETARVSDVRTRISCARCRSTIPASTPPWRSRR